MPILVALLLLLLFSRPLAQPCGLTCTFRLCHSSGDLSEGGRALLQRAPFVPAQGPVICSVQRKLGYVLQTGEARVVIPGRPRIPISRFAPPRLTAPFSPRFFDVRRIKSLGKSAVVKAKGRGNQQRVLDGLCIRLPILKYQRLFKKGTIRRVVTTRGKGTDCVAFRARVPLLLVELSWVGGDDLDLAVITPRGDLLSRFNQVDGKGGRFWHDSPSKCRQRMPVGKEFVRYWLDGDVASGEYLVQLRHFKNCGDGPTKWNLRVTVADKVRVFERGRTDADDSFLFRQLTFQV